MSIFNQRPVSDVRKVLTGKNGGLFDGEGNLMATVDSFTATVNISNAKYQPLGDAQEHSTMSSFAVALKIDQFVIEDDALIKSIVKGMQEHVMPVLNFQGVTKSPYNGSEERMIYRDCVPDGSIDLQNLTVGDIYKRSTNWVCNQPPDLQSMLEA